HGVALAALPVGVLGRHVNVPGELELPQVREVPATERDVDRGGELLERVLAPDREDAARTRPEAKARALHELDRQGEPGACHAATVPPVGGPCQHPRGRPLLPLPVRCKLRRRQSRWRAWPSRSGRRGRSTASTSRSGRVASRASSAPTARARPRSCACSRPCSGRTPDPPGCSAATCCATPRAYAR